MIALFPEIPEGDTRATPERVAALSRLLEAATSALKRKDFSRADQKARQAQELTRRWFPRAA